MDFRQIMRALWPFPPFSRRAQRSDYGQRAAVPSPLAHLVSDGGGSSDLHATEQGAAAGGRNGDDSCSGAIEAGGPMAAKKELSLQLFGD
jgi:hypothetical protein